MAHYVFMYVCMSTVFGCCMYCRFCTNYYPSPTRSVCKDTLVGECVS